MLGEQDTIAETTAEAAAVQHERVELNIDEALMPRLQGDRDTLQAIEQERTSQLETLQSALVNYEDHAPRYWHAGKRRGSAGVMRFICLMLALVLAILWALPRFMPDSAAAAFLQNHFPVLVSNTVATGLLIAAIIMVVLALVFQVRRSTHTQTMQREEQAASTLAASLEHLPEPYVSARDEDLLAVDDLEVTMESGSVRLEQQVLKDLHERTRDISASTKEARQVVDMETEWQTAELEKVAADVAALDQEIAVEEARLSKAAQLDDMHASLKDKIADLERRVEARKLGNELLLGAASHITRRFNQELRDLVAVTLPPLTEGRYEYLKIDSDLNVQAFSSEKRDFVDLDEVSSGTQRQIMLAVRLALAQELINRTVQGHQFLFLDEPFAFFDQKRTREALAVLPQLSDEISQIWIVAQQFPSDMEFAGQFHCAREIKALAAE
jgi:exonuclease SbcC